MVGDAHSPHRRRHSSRVHEVKIESDVNTPGTPFPFSRGQTPRKPVVAGIIVTEIEALRNVFVAETLREDNPQDTCKLCASKGYICGIKIRSDQQAQIKAQGQGEMKGMNARRQFQWNETDNFLDNIIYLARNNMLPEKVVAKLADEINLYLQGKNESLPAPQVLPHDPPQYTQLQDAGPAPMPPPQNVYIQYISPAFLQASQPWGQAPGNYSPQPNHSVHGNQPAMQTPIGTPQPITPDLRQGIPRLPTDTQLPTAAPQALDNLAPDWMEQSGNFDWRNDIYSRPDFPTLYDILSNTGTPQDFDVPMENWDNGPCPI